MILLYHKIGLTNPTKWWVTINDFYRQMSEIQSKKVVYLDEYDITDSNQVVITFDGAYECITKFAVPILNGFNFPFEVFVIGGQIGKDNAWDTGEPREMFASLTQLAAIVKNGGRLQWHSQTHVDLSQATDARAIDAELQISNDLHQLDPNGFRWLAYPFGRFNELSILRAQKYFSGALSCHQGNGQDKFQYNRITVVNDTSFRSSRITVIIPCFNYGRFLPEAVESVLCQTVPAFEIFIADDASTDNTAEIGRYYAQKYPTLIHYHRNETNLGIVRNFNQAVAGTRGEYVCILGADNRLLSNYLEICANTLDNSPNVAVAYTDLSLFGPRAELVYNQFQKAYRGRILDNSCFLIDFPEFNSIIKKNLAHNNILHGTSMFRRIAFNQAGGYREKGMEPEDQLLFKKMLELKWQAKKAHNTRLEYRQHSDQQANIKKNSDRELLFYKSRVKELEKELHDWHRSYLYRIPRALKKMIPNKVKDFLRKIQSTIRKDGLARLLVRIFHSLRK